MVMKKKEIERGMSLQVTAAGIRYRLENLTTSDALGLLRTAVFIIEAHLKKEAADFVSIKDAETNG